MAEPVAAAAEEITPPPEAARPRQGLALLGRRDFRRLFAAVAASELGDAFHYIALMWLALQLGGPIGVLVVRLADSVPALVFGLHGGLAADRWDRRRLMIAADLARGALLVPVAAAALLGDLPLWGLVLAAFLLQTATSYFEPAYGALLPSIVDRRNIQRANALVQATVPALLIGGWAVAAGLLAVLPVSAFFAVNAASFFVSALLIAAIRTRRAPQGADPPSIREGLAELRPRPALATGVIVLAIVVTISAGSWIAGVPTLVDDELGRGAASFSVVMIGYAVGAIASGFVLARVPIARKASVGMVAWTLYLPAYGLIALDGSLGVVVAGALAAGLGEASGKVLLRSAAQEDVPDRALGRVMGLIALVDRGAHATGLLLVSPLFAVVAPQAVFLAAALAIPLVGLTGATVAARQRAPS